MTRRSYIVKMNVEEILNATRGKLLIGNLKENCENISAVLRHLCEDSEKKKELLKIVSGLPENEIKDIGFITTQLDDVIFALREKYINSSELFDAKKLSDEYKLHRGNVPWNAIYGLRNRIVHDYGNVDRKRHR